MEFSKYKAHSIGRLLLHNNRSPNDGVTHSNEDIDNERTMFNYHFKKGTAEDVQKRISELVPFKRSNQTELAELIITLPKDVKPEDERAFFESAYNFFCDDLGEENIINAVIHKDETTPHMHLDFVPVIKADIHYARDDLNKIVHNWQASHENQTPERLCCKGLINRTYLQNVHQRLSAYMNEELGYPTSILNGATDNGNKAVLQLKIERMKAKLEAAEKQLRHLNEDVQKIHKLAQRWGISESDISLLPLMGKIDELERKNAVLRDIITRNDYMYTNEDMLKLRAASPTTAKSSSLNVLDGSFVNAELEKNAVLVVELPTDKDKLSPQEKLLDVDDDLYRQMKLARTSSAPVVTRASKISDRVYLFVKTENEKKTMENMYMFEQQLKAIADLRNRKVYMDRIESDTYDFAKSILQTMDCEARYYTGRIKEESEQAKQMEHNQ